MKTKLPKELEIGMVCVTKRGEVIKITQDDMQGHPYESFKRLATKKEINSLKK